MSLLSALGPVAATLRLSSGASDQDLGGEVIHPARQPHAHPADPQGSRRGGHARQAVPGFAAGIVPWYWRHQHAAQEAAPVRPRAPARERPRRRCPPRRRPSASSARTAFPREMSRGPCRPSRPTTTRTKTSSWSPTLSLNRPPRCSTPTSPPHWGWSGLPSQPLWYIVRGPVATGQLRRPARCPEPGERMLLSAVAHGHRQVEARRLIESRRPATT